MPKASDQPAGPTRARILAAAAALVAELGWRQVTTRRIAARAGVNQALVHYHFGSVAELLRQAVIGRLEDELSEPTARLLEEGDPAAGVRELSAWLRRLDPGSPVAVLSAEALAEAVRDDALRDWMGRLLADARRRLESTVVNGQERGTVRADVPAHGIATLTAALVDGLIFHRLVDHRVELEDAAEALERMLAPGGRG